MGDILWPNDDFTWTGLLVRLAVAAACGAVFGFEREMHEKPAGLRTQIMVALGACTFTLITLQFFNDVNQQGERPFADPLRVVSGVVGGIGFLGAGTIIRYRGGVMGMTTAATIWLVGALGIAAGLGYHRIVAVALGFGFATLTIIGTVEYWFFGAGSRHEKRILEVNEEGEDP